MVQDNYRHCHVNVKLFRNPLILASSDLTIEKATFLTLIGESKQRPTIGLAFILFFYFDVRVNV